VVVALAAVAALVVALEVPLCPTASVFGVPCPGCGLTRATLALLRGDARTALHLHPLVFLLAPLYFAVLGAAAVAYVRAPLAAAPRRRAWIAGRGVTALASLLLVLVLGVWVARFFGAFGGPAPVRPVWASLDALRR